MDLTPRQGVDRFGPCRRRASAASTIPGLVRRAAREFGDREALVDDDGAVRLDFSRLEEIMVWSTRAAIAAGLEPGDRASIWAPNIHQWIVAALGILGAGGVLVPLNTRFKGDEAAYVLGKSRARMLFTVTGFLDTDYVAMLARRPAPSSRRSSASSCSDGDAPDGTISALDYLAAGDAVTRGRGRRADRRGRRRRPLRHHLHVGHDRAPQGCDAHARSVAARRTTSWTDVIGLREGDRYLIVNPFFHAFGYKAGWMSCIMRGATIVPVQGVRGRRTCSRMVAEERITVLPGPPTLLQGILDYPDREQRTTCRRCASR